MNGVLIEEDLSDAELADLFLCADAYVSLHRSEGFGFGIAEAMSVGKPVIATAYSGNLDFRDGGEQSPGRLPLVRDHECGPHLQRGRL